MLFFPKVKIDNPEAYPNKLDVNPMDRNLKMSH